MSEFVMLLQDVADAGWVFLVGVLVVAAGLFLFDRRTARSAARDEADDDQRRAA